MYMFVCFLMQQAMVKMPCHGTQNNSKSACWTAKPDTLHPEPHTHRALMYLKLSMLEVSLGGPGTWCRAARATY